MHTVQVFVVRLFVDSEQPGAVRGALQAMPEEEVHLFSDAQSLVELLVRMTTPVDTEGGSSESTAKQERDRTPC